MRGGHPGGASGKEHGCQCRRRKRHRLDPWVEKIPRGGHGNPLHYSFLENAMGRGAWQATKISLIMKKKHYFWLRGIRSSCGGSVSGPPLKRSA